MAGHSKWANIKHKKASQDAKRGKIFTKLIREITVAAKLGGGDAGSNPRLRDAVDRALRSNMKRDTIDKAVKRGAGGLEGGDLEEIRYEGYGPSGVAVMVDCLSDNRNRTVAEVRHAFTKYNGNLGTDGSVSYLFEKKGVILFPGTYEEDAIMEAALEAGALEIKKEGDVWEVQTSPEEFLSVRETMERASFESIEFMLTEVADVSVPVNADKAQTLLNLIDKLEDLDDVQKVYTNADLSDEVLESLV